MEEAQILGSRIAIMNRGIVVCCGSVPFLKKTFGRYLNEVFQFSVIKGH